MPPFCRSQISDLSSAGSRSLLETTKRSLQKLMLQLNHMGTLHIHSFIHSLTNSNNAFSEATYTFNPILLDGCLHFALHPAIVQSTDKDSIFLPNRLGRFIYYDKPTYQGSIYSHLRLVEWTPGSLLPNTCFQVFLIHRIATRVYDIDVYDGSGKPLCSLHRLELREVSTLPPVVINKRYDLIHQPVAIDESIMALDEPLSIYDEDERDLHHYLDILSQGIIAESLAVDPEVSYEASLVNHNRYTR